MAVSLNDITTNIGASLRSYTGLQEQMTWLTGNISPLDLTIPMNMADAAVRGVIEIEDELVYVAASDTNAVTVAPFGRGYRGTVAAFHSTNAPVVLNPAYPRSDIVRVRDQIIEGLYPTLYGVKTVDLIGDAVSIGYEMPADCEGILKVEWHPLGDVQNYWPEIYEYDFDANSAAFPSGKALNLHECVDVGANFRVTYKVRPTVGQLDETLEDVGLPDSCADVILYGVTAQMLRFVDSARLSVRSVESVSRAQVVGVGDAAKVANSLYAVYQQRLAEERRRLLLQYPPSPKFQR